MYDHHIRRMKNWIVLLTKQYPDRPLEDNINAGLNEYWRDKIALVWDAVDIIEYAKEEMNIDLENYQAINILAAILKNHNCEYGVTWDTIRYEIEDYLRGE